MYMNVCIWGLVKEERKELLLGKVFLSILLPLWQSMLENSMHVLYTLRFP